MVGKVIPWHFLDMCTTRISGPMDVWMLGSALTNFIWLKASAPCASLFISQGLRVVSKLGPY